MNYTNDYIKIYPQLVYEEFTIEPLIPITNIEMKILNTLGQEIRTIRLSEIKQIIHVEDLNPGIYLLNFLKDNHLDFHE